MNDSARDLAGQCTSGVISTIVAPGIERADVRLVGSSFSAHRHDTYAIGYTTRGVQSFDYRGVTRQFRRTFGLTPGRWRSLATGSAAGSASGPAG